MMVKHKGEKFSETKTLREVDPEKLKVLSEAQAVADEWITAMRLEHVIDKLTLGGGELSVKDTKKVISAMVQDVKDESEGEIIWSKEVSKALGKSAAKLFHKRLKAKLTELK